MRQKVTNKLYKYKILKMIFVWIVELQGNGKYEDNPDFHINPCLSWYLISNKSPDHCLFYSYKDAEVSQFHYKEYNKSIN